MSYRCLINGEKVTVTSQIVNDAVVPAPEFCTSTPAPTEASISQRIATHKAPKLYNQLQQGAEGEDNFERAHLWDVLTLDTSLISTLPEYLGPAGTIRTRNNNAIITFYWSTADWNFYSINPMEELFNSQFIADWVVRDVNGNPVKLFQAPPNENFSSFWTYLRNLSNEEFVTYFVNFLNDNIMLTGLADGIFYDWAATDMSWMDTSISPPQTTGGIDYNQDGIADTDDEANAAWVTGWKSMAELSSQTYPTNSVLMGNAGWATGNDYVDYINGVMIEQFLRAPIEYPTLYSWSQQMAVYSYYAVNSVYPKLSVIQAAEEQDNYQYMRFTLSSALMFNGYYSFTNKDVPSIAYQTTWWYDEYAVNTISGVASESLAYKGWLGHPLTDAYSVSDSTNLLYDVLQAGTMIAETRVWRRDYQNGIVICNPTSGSVEIELGDTYRKIQGVVDPDFNDGSEITSITLNSRDGVLLLNG